MKRLYIIVEGQTEEEFVNSLLIPFFTSIGIHHNVSTLLLSTSSKHKQKGGSLNYDRFKDNIEPKLKRENDIIVTSLIDFFQLDTGFPKFEEGKKIIDKVQRVNFLEKAITENINSERFIPYIQLHEFEGLLFSDTKGFDYLDKIDNNGREKLHKIVNEYPNPELLNDGLQTAPSKRLMDLIPAYDKTVDGPIIAMENTLATTMEKCPRFKNWIETLIAEMKNEKNYFLY